MEGAEAAVVEAAVEAVVAGLARLLTADGGRLVLTSHDRIRRVLVVVVGPAHDGDGPVARAPVDAAVVRDYLLEGLSWHGVHLADVRVDIR